MFLLLLRQPSQWGPLLLLGLLLLLSPLL